MVTIPGVDNINWAGYGASIYNLGTYLVIMIVIFGIFFIYWYMSGFKINATVVPINGSGQKGTYSLGKVKYNKFKWIEKRTAWRPMKPLFNKKKIEPFNPEFIYPGNRVIVFEYGDYLIPGEYCLNEIAGKLEAKISPVPYYIRNWQSYSHKRNNLEYASHDFWENNKYFILGVITVLICCAACIITVWLTYKFAAPGTQAMNNLADSIRNLGVIPGM